MEILMKARKPQFKPTMQYFESWALFTRFANMTQICQILHIK